MYFTKIFSKNIPLQASPTWPAKQVGRTGTSVLGGNAAPGKSLTKRSVYVRTPLYSYCETGGASTPDIWFNPQEVWQIAAADITSSPVYTAAASFLGMDRGVSLRFPRFISVREDKGIEEATTTEQLADMYRQQMA